MESISRREMGQMLTDESGKRGSSSDEQRRRRQASDRCRPRSCSRLDMPFLEACLDWLHRHPMSAWSCIQSIPFQHQCIENNKDACDRIEHCVFDTRSNRRWHHQPSYVFFFSSAQRSCQQSRRSQQQPLKPRPILKGHHALVANSTRPPYCKQRLV